jgi:DnaJ-class molecular chaperone
MRVRELYSTEVPDADGYVNCAHCSGWGRFDDPGDGVISCERCDGKGRFFVGPLSLARQQINCWWCSGGTDVIDDGGICSRCNGEGVLWVTNDQLAAFPELDYHTRCSDDEVNVG